MEQGDESAAPLGIPLSVRVTQQYVQKKPANKAAAGLYYKQRHGSAKE